MQDFSQSPARLCVPQRPQLQNRRFTRHCSLLSREGRGEGGRVMTPYFREVKKEKREHLSLLLGDV